MKKLKVVCLLVLFFIMQTVQLRAQEIEVDGDLMYFRSNNSLSTMYWYSGGTVALVGNLSNLFTSVVYNGNQVALRVLNNWNYPAAFEVYGNGTVKVNGVAVHSDSTLKEDITSLDSQIENIKKLRGVSYKWKEDRGFKEGKRIYGLLAQEVEKVYPDMVCTDDSTGIKSIFYTELIPVLLEVVQEQQEEIESQAKQMLDIEKRLSKLEKGSKN